MMDHSANHAAPHPHSDAGAHAVRVLIVDDEALMRAGIRLMIDGASTGSHEDARRIAVVGEAADGAEALAAAHTLDPDVILMDIRMPGMSGVEATKALQAAGSRARVIILTAFDTDEFVLDALQGGAVSFLLKDSAPELVLAAVRDAALGQPRLSPAVMARLVALAGAGATAGPAPAGATPTEHTPTVTDAVPAPAGVTPREWDVALLVAQGVRTKDIAAELYISASTVKTHLSNLSAKLHASNRTQIALRVNELRDLGV